VVQKGSQDFFETIGASNRRRLLIRVGLGGNIISRKIREIFEGYELRELEPI
jgi:hypothetical protein